MAKSIRNDSFDTKLVGDISEWMVTVNLLKLGITPLHPVGDRLSFDIVAWSNNIFLPIQVRTAYLSEPDDIWVGNVRCAKTNRKRCSYIKSDTRYTNFFIFVIQPLEIFYVIPSSVIDVVKSSITMIPHRARKRDGLKIESYRGAWHLLK